MQAYLGGTDVTVTIPLVDAAGNALSADSIEYRVIDQDEQVVVAKVALSGYGVGDPDAIVTIPAASNDLGTLKRAVRAVELFVTTGAGVVMISHEYVVEALETLVVGENSLMTYSSAVLVAFDIPNLPGWNQATKQERMRALHAAYRNLGKVKLRFVDDDSDMTSVITPEEWNSSNVTDFSAAQLAALNAKYVACLKRAQLIEADFLLGGDEVDAIRRSGIMSATVGESSQFYRTQKPLDGPICKRAMREVSEYMNTRVRVGRA